MFNKTIDYDNVSKVYDQVRTGDPEMVRQILDDISLNPQSLVLDVGCGTANNTLLLAAASASRVVGLDISYGMLEKAKEKKSQLLFIQAPADSLPLADDSFDFVFMTEVIHHLPDASGSIREIHRTLRKRGSLCIVTQSHKQIEERMTSRFFPASAKVDQERYPDINTIEDILLSSGFRDVHPKAHSFSPVKLGDDYFLTVTKRGYSMLHKISNDDYEKGIKKLKAAYDAGEELMYPAGYTFVWARK